MKRWLCISSVVVLLSGGCSTVPKQIPEKFTLQAYMLPTIGPFGYQHGEKLKIAETEYVLVKEEPETWEMEALLASITVPEADFREADIRDVLRFLSEGARPVPPDLNIVFKSKPDEIPKITLALQNASMLQILKTVCDLANLKYDVKHGVIIVEAK